MKTTLCFIAMLLITVNISAQPITGFTETKTIQADGYVYQCDVHASKMVTLYNKENKLTYEDIVYKATGERFGSQIMDEEESLIINNPTTNRKVKNIVNESFKPSTVFSLEDRPATFIMCINPQTGKVIEVYFNFFATTPYATKATLAEYRRVEKQLKSQISFTPTNLGKQLNYIMLCWSQTPNGRVVPPIIE